MDTENVERSEAAYKIKELILKVRMDIEEMEAIMKTIDDRHIVYRTRAVQRAQFLLLSDGSIKSKINNLLQYYSNEIKVKEDLYEDDNTVISEVFKVYGQNYFDSQSLATPVKKKKSTPIEIMQVVDEIDMDYEKSFQHSDSKIILYYAERGEQLWDIAKKYYSTIEIIKRDNDIEGDSVSDSRMLIISHN